MRVVCLLGGRNRRYRAIAKAMQSGIERCGDEAVITDTPEPADFAVIYGWRRRDWLFRYPHWMYADLGYWNRDAYYRVSVGGWSPHRYLRFGMGPERLKSLGVRVLPWHDGDEILVVGASEKSMAQHGYRYMEWEKRMVARLQGMGTVVYRPKPNDVNRQPISGALLDDRPVGEALAAARLVVTHHSNMAIDALVAGVPVYCETGAGAAFSLPFGSFDRLSGREAFLADVAWHQWSLNEMADGTCWSFLKEKGIVQC